jgi:hypothetical protein
MNENPTIWDDLCEWSKIFRSSVRASAPIGDDDLGYFVNVQGMTPEQLAGLILVATDDTEQLAMLAAAAISALVLRDYEQDQEQAS